MAELKEQFLHLWSNFSKQQKILLGVGAAALFTIIVGWSYLFGGRADYVPLYTNLETRDAGDIVANFKDNNVSYELADSGSSILVPQRDVYQLRMDLASQGLPRGKKGFEMFEDSKFGTTEFQNKVNYLQALQGELGRTIEQIQEVEAARVHIVLPQDSLYRKNEKPASASVMLQLRNNLGKDQVQGIVNLVAHSVQGLTPDNITLIDGMAKVLNQPQDEAGAQAELERESNADAGAMSKFYFNLTREIQTDMQENVQTLLDTSLGERRAVARVTVELNFDRRLIDRQIFEPTTEDKGILRSTQDVTETYQGGGDQDPGGVPGTASNIPGYPGQFQSQSNYEKRESTKNYEISEIKEKIIQQPVSIKRVTVAVFIDESLTQAQQDSITRVVASAAGFNETRGDLVSVERIPFSIPDSESTLPLLGGEAGQNPLLRYILYALPLVLLLAGGLGWYFYSKRKKEKALQEEAARQEEERIRLAAEQVSYQQDAEQSAAKSLLETGEDDEDYEPVVLPGRTVTQEEREFLAKKEAIEELAENKPEEFVATLRTWLATEE